MSSTSSNSPAGMDASEEPRKKGSRGGKRSVTHLSKAQLARKRANDREAQRNIRQRTKEHIEHLEKRVKELESQGGRSSSMERVLKRNQELEAELETLRAQVASIQAPPVQVPPEIPEELLIPQKVTLEWLPESSCTTWETTLPTLAAGSQLQAPNATFPEAPVFAPVPNSVGFEDETSQTLYTNAPVITPIWEDPVVFGPQTSQSITKAGQATPWVPFHPAFSQPSRFSDLQQSRFNDIINTPSYQSTTCWQNQPSVYAWQISTKLKAPVTLVDHLMLQVINSQRHLSITSDLTGEDILGPAFPSVHILFNQPGPLIKKPSTLTEVMERYSAVLSSRGFALIPEKLASFMCMYRFIQWQISPSYQTYQMLHEWQTPEQSQLDIPHPAWMDLVPWGKFRDRIIRNQDKYDNVEFQSIYASNLSVNFPYDPMKALIFEKGQIMISPLLDKHLSDIRNISMKRPFADRYPDFKDVCRFDEV